MNRGQVFQVGFIALLIGGIGYLGFRTFGFDSVSAGIAAEAVLILIVLGWTGSYFFRVITGKMTFIEQRKRYRKSYDEFTNSKLLEKFESMTDEEKRSLMNELDD